METYQFEVKQLVDYPRCRMYRNFFRSLESNYSVRLNSQSHLYYYIALCSYANYRSSYRKLDGVSYLLGPGEWIFRQTELMDSFRQRRPAPIFSALDFLQANHFIGYSRVGSGKLIRIKITEWEKFNTALEYNAPCAKAEGFFFVPMTIAEQLVGLGKCSEMDILLDLWLHAVYQDDRVKGSNKGPVVYFRDGSGDPFLSYSQMADRWGISKSTVYRVFQKLVDLDYAMVISFPGTYGTAVYIKGYLSVMFQLSDTPLDKQEIAMEFEIVIQTNDTVSPEDDTVSNSVMEQLADEIGKVLSECGSPCVFCSQAERKLYRLSDCAGNLLHPPVRYKLEFGCRNDQRRYRFVISQISEGGENNE